MTIPLDGVHRVHFVGINGIGMSSLARLLVARGYQVSGSDRMPGEQSRGLAALGVQVGDGHRAEHISGADVVIVTWAVPADNPEVQAARAQGIPVVQRAALLAGIVNPSRGIAVAGTHGKTTTSALIGWILTVAGLDPTVLIGGVSTNLGSNARVGTNGLVVAEADEFGGTFLYLRPKIAVITNVEPEHLDTYGTVEKLQQAFHRFAAGVDETLVACADDPVVPTLVQGLHARVQTYGIERGIWRAEGIEEERTMTRFRVAGEGQTYAMRLAGLHNVRNALAAILVARTVGVPEVSIVEALAGFGGVARRSEVRGEVGGVLVIDDYAHHPTEIRATLAALKQRFGRPIRLVFQPHTYSRTLAFLPDFASAFADADVVYLLDIYAAREADVFGISGEDLARAAAQRHPAALYTETIQQATARLLRDVRPGDLVVTMGAGDVDRLGPQLLRALENR